MSRIRLGKNAVSVELSHDLDRMIRRVTENVYPGLMERLEEDAQEIMDNARKEWPIGRRRKPPREHSADLFYLETRVDPGWTTIYVTVKNHADYARYIMPTKLWGGSAYVEWLRKPFRERRKILAKELALLSRGLLEGGRIW